MKNFNAKKWAHCLTILFVSISVWGASAQGGLSYVKTKHQLPKQIDNALPLKKVLKDLSSKYNVTFHYNSPIVKDKYVRDTPLEDLLKALQVIQEQTNLSFEKINTYNYMVLDGTKKSDPLSPERVRDTHISETEAAKSTNVASVNSPKLMAAFPVKGKVVDGENDEPLIGVSVVLKGTATGAITDENGDYTIDLPSGDGTLLFSFVGYEVKEVSIRNQKEINVRMSTDAIALKEAVVTGYGDVRKRDELSGAVTQVTSETITLQPVTSVDQALAGMSPGVTLREGTGAPGAGPEILIRGINTFGNNKPLIVIDDIIFENGNDQNNNPLALLNPEDIESVVILKDAATKAIYGSRGTAGVILVTTKKGKIGQSKIRFNTSVGFNTVLPFEDPDVLNATELAQFFKEKEIDKIRTTNPLYKDLTVPVPDALIPEQYRNPTQYGEGTNWFKEITRTAMTQNHNISAEGGTAAVRYFVSANYTNQEGIVLANDFTRYSLRANIDVRLSDKFKMNLNLNPSRTERNRSSDEPGNGQFSAGSTITSAYWVDPSVPVFSSPGVYNYITKGSLTTNWQANPVYQLLNEIEKRRNTQILMNWGAEFEPIKNLIFKTKFNVNYTQGRSRNFKPSNLVTGNSLTPVFPDPDSAIAVLANSTINNYISDNIINYRVKFGKNNFDIIGGYLVQEYSEENSNMTAKKLLDENFILPDFGNVSKAANGNFSGAEDFRPWRLTSLISRLHYSHDNKYLVNLSYRRDGSSRAGRGEGSLYGGFPAGNFIWRASEENFMKKRFKWLNDLRFEVGYGITGNLNGLSEYGHLGRIGQANYPFGSTVTLGNTIDALPNEFATWEEAEQWDIGLNLSILKERVKIAFNVYEQKTGNPIAQIPVSWATGFGSVFGNQKSLIRNRGFEVDLNVTPINRKNFRWNFNINASRYSNLLLEYYVPQGFLSGNAGNSTQIAISAPGQPLGMYRGLRILGLYTAAEIADATVPKYPGAIEGNIKYFDGNGNGKLEAGDADYVILGNPHPDLMFGINNMLSYKGFNLRTQFAGQLGGLIYDLRREIMWNVDGNFNINREMLERWRPGGDLTATDFQTTTGNNSNKVRWPSDNKVYDGSYIALKNVTLSYNLGKFLNKRKRLLEAAEIYTSVRNAFYLAAYKFGNPEVRRANDGSALRSVNYGSYPIFRSIVFGLNVTF
jgi:TonB-dependent starch-binding outer membrane protein SusC